MNGLTDWMLLISARVDQISVILMAVAGLVVVLVGWVTWLAISLRHVRAVALTLGEARLAELAEKRR